MSPEIEFLTARWDEREAAAHAASPGGWTYHGIDSISGSTLYDETRSIAYLDYDQDDAERTIVRPILEPEADANGAHIALNAPAYVLADIAAKRAIVEMARGIQRESDTFGDDSSDWRVGWHDARTGTAADVISHLLQPFAEHPDFDPAWRVA